MVMKYKFFFFFLLASSFVFGQTNYQIANFSLVIKGTSNLHDWESTAKEVRARGAMTSVAGVLKSIESLTVEIPVKTIKSPKGSIMDNKTYDALKAGSSPNITYKLGKVTGLSKKGDGYDINTVGYLTIAGVTNTIDMYVRGKAGSDGSLSFSGSKKLKI